MSEEKKKMVQYAGKAIEEITKEELWDALQEALDRVTELEEYEYMYKDLL